MPRESTEFIIWVRSTEGQKLILRAADLNTNFAEIANGKALDDECIKARHLVSGLIPSVAGIRAGSGTCSASNGETAITFSSALSSTSYAVAVCFESALVGGLTIMVKSKTVNGFTVAILDMGSNPVDCSVDNINFSWQAISNA